MIIKCYLFSDRTLQMGHTYYSLGECAYFHFDLEYYKNFCCLEFPFIYEVEVESDNILFCNKDCISSTAYKITKELQFQNVIPQLGFTKTEQNELYNILSGKMPEKELLNYYTRTFNINKLDLVKFEKWKLLAILIQNKYNLPELEIEKDFQTNYIKILEYFDKPYYIPTFNTYNSKVKKCTIQKLYGSKTFETIDGECPSILIYKVILQELIMTRQLTQNQFNQILHYVRTEELSLPYMLTRAAVIAGYEILNENRELFYPYILYQDPEKHLDLIKERDTLKLNEGLLILFNCGYKFKSCDYNNMSNYYERVITAKTIFQKGFKYIE